jgi:hypothetical protein
MTLNPGQRYAYSASRALPSGTYTAWPAALIDTAWRELAPRQTYTVP